MCMRAPASAVAPVAAASAVRCEMVSRVARAGKSVRVDPAPLLAREARRLLRDRLCRLDRDGLRGRPLLDGDEVLLAERVLDQAEDHADAGGGEADVPVDLLSEPAGDERREEGAEVDAHVENGERGVAARVVARVERADDGADVRLQKDRA